MGEVQNNSKTQTLFVGVFGAYLLSGAGYSFFTAKWFPGFPPQLDISMLFGGMVGIYVEAALASIIGVSCIYLAVIVGRKQTT